MTEIRAVAFSSYHFICSVDKMGHKLLKSKKFQIPAAIGFASRYIRQPQLFFEDSDRFLAKLYNLSKILVQFTVGANKMAFSRSTFSGLFVICASFLCYKYAYI